jgi:biopolymer transport protein ExbD
MLALTPNGLWVGEAKVASVALALEDPRLREQNPDVLLLAVDGRVPFSKLVDVLDAAGELKRQNFDMLVQSASGDLAVVRVRNAASIPPDTGDRPPLNVTVRLSETEFELSATVGSLDPQPLAELSKVLKEIKASFPTETNVRVTADAGLSMDALVKAIDGLRETEERELLFPNCIVGRFEPPVPNFPGPNPPRLKGSSP